MFGEVVEGKGKAEKFLGMEEYSEKIFAKMNFKVFPGTLNLRVDVEELKNFLQGREKRRIEGFEKQGKKFGGIVCYKIHVGGIPAAIVFPKKSSHAEDVIEIISFVNLKERLKLGLGDKIQIE